VGRWKQCLRLVVVSAMVGLFQTPTAPEILSLPDRHTAIGCGRREHATTRDKWHIHRATSVKLPASRPSSLESHWYWLSTVMVTQDNPGACTSTDINDCSSA